jgi:hypothetical protein
VLKLRDGYCRVCAGNTLDCVVHPSGGLCSIGRLVVPVVVTVPTGKPSFGGLRHEGVANLVIVVVQLSRLDCDKAETNGAATLWWVGPDGKVLARFPFFFAATNDSNSCQKGWSTP